MYFLCRHQTKDAAFSLLQPDLQTKSFFRGLSRKLRPPTITTANRFIDIFLRFWP